MIDRAGHSASARILSRIFLVAFTFFMGADLAHAASAYIRVNQVGYAGSSTKRAYLMASGSETGAAFAVKNSSGTTVYSASVGTSLEHGELSPASTPLISIPYRPPEPTRFRWPRR